MSLKLQNGRKKKLTNAKNFWSSCSRACIQICPFSNGLNGNLKFDLLEKLPHTRRLWRTCWTDQTVDINNTVRKNWSVLSFPVLHVSLPVAAAWLQTLPSGYPSVSAAWFSTAPLGWARLVVFSSPVRYTLGNTIGSFFSLSVGTFLKPFTAGWAVLRSSRYVTLLRGRKDGQCLHSIL